MNVKSVICLAFGVLFILAVSAAVSSGYEARAFAGGNATATQWHLSSQTSGISSGVSVPLTTTTPSPTFSPTSTPTPCPLLFSDVQPSDYFYEAVRWLYCHGAISGYADGTFRPGTNVTRGQAIKIQVLAFDVPIYVPPGPEFCGLPSTDPFYIYVTSLYHYLPLSCEGPIRTNAYSTRGQACKQMVYLACWPIYTPPTPTFRDVPTNGTFYQYIETAYHFGVISGYSCGAGCLEFRPNNNVTRGQASKIIYRSVQQRVCTPTPTPLPTPPPPAVVP